MTEEEILKEFPYLEKEDFQAAYGFFASIPHLAYGAFSPATDGVIR